MEHEYLFDAKLFVAVRVKATSASEARRELQKPLDCAEVNLGEGLDGQPMLAEASIDGSADLVEIDGQTVPSRLDHTMEIYITRLGKAAG